MIWLRAVRHVNDREVRLLLVAITKANGRILGNFVKLLVVETKIAIWQTVLFMVTGRLR